jgi:hypothetical protein
VPEIPRREFLASAGAALTGLAAMAAIPKAFAASSTSSPATRSPSMKRYVIEREVAGIGGSDAAQCALIAATSNAALAKLSPHIQWEHSYFTADKTFCVYLAEDEAAIHEHSKLSGFPANKITLVTAIVDPTTAG